MSAPFEPPDFWSMHARKLLGLPETWRWYSLESIGERPRAHCLIKGAIPDGVLFKSGPRKGQLNWKHRSAETTVVISFGDHHAFVAGWEKETGLCSSCGNTGTSCGRSPCHHCGRKAEVSP